MSLSQSRVSTGFAIVVFVALESLVIVQFWLSYRDGLLTNEQMEVRGLANGLPLIWHFGVWSDGLMLSGLLAWLVLKSSSSWTIQVLSLSAVASLALTAFMNWSYTLSVVPEGHVVDRSLTASGWAHAVYMGIALTIVLTFFSQSDQVSSRRKNVVSWLLLGHVFVGTHMLLGLLDVGDTLPWYSGTPLTSIAGWSVVCLVGISLVMANMGVTVASQRTLAFLKLAGTALAWLNDQQPGRARGYLKLLDSLVDIPLAATAFFLIAFVLLGSGAPPLSLILIVVIALTWFMSRLSVKHELGISDKLFPPDRVPDALVPASRLSILFRVTMFTLSYLVLTWFSGAILIVSACFVVIEVISTRLSSAVA